MKVCPSCLVKKDLSSYWKNQACCIECSKWKQKNSWNSRTPKKRLEQHLKYKYQIDLETFLTALKVQEGACEICKTILPDLFTYENRRRGYAIDHNHETGEFRGILCLECNTLLGMAGDNSKILKSAIKYLGKNGNYSNMAIARKKKSSGK